MATGKKSFIFYCNWVNTFKELPKDKGYDLLMHILSYVNDENPQTDDILIKAIFANIKDILKADLEKWEKQQKQRSEAGKASARSRKRKPTSVNERSISSTVNVNDNVIVNVNDNVVPYVYLKEKHAQRLEVFEMQNKSNIDNYDQFIENFNAKVVLEEIPYEANKLFARLNQLKSNWKKEKKVPPKKEKASDIIQRELNIK